MPDHQSKQSNESHLHYRLYQNSQQESFPDDDEPSPLPPGEPPLSLHHLLRRATANTATQQQQQLNSRQVLYRLEPQQSRIHANPRTDQTVANALGEAQSEHVAAMAVVATVMQAQGVSRTSYGENDSSSISRAFFQSHLQQLQNNLRYGSPRVQVRNDQNNRQDGEEITEDSIDEEIFPRPPGPGPAQQ